MHKCRSEKIPLGKISIPLSIICPSLQHTRSPLELSKPLLLSKRGKQACHRQSNKESLPHCRGGMRAACSDTTSFIKSFTPAYWTDSQRAPAKNRMTSPAKSYAGIDTPSFITHPTALRCTTGRAQAQAGVTLRMLSSNLSHDRWNIPFHKASALHHNMMNLSDLGTII